MFSINIKELIDRPIIRNDYAEEFMNKMNDEEIKIFYTEVDRILELEGVPKIFPYWNS